MIFNNDYDIIIYIAAGVIVGAVVFGLAIKLRLKTVFDRKLAALDSARPLSRKSSPPNWRFHRSCVIGWSSGMGRFIKSDHRRPNLMWPGPLWRPQQAAYRLWKKS